MLFCQGVTRRVDSALIVGDLDSWVSALLAVTVSRCDLGLDTFVHRPWEACRPVGEFSFWP